VASPGVNLKMSDTTPTAPTQPNAVHKLWADTTLQITCGIVLVYAIGFIVCNSAFGKIDPAGVDLAPIRFIGAAILLVVSTVVPVVLGYTSASLLSWRSVLMSALWILTVIIGLAMWIFVFSVVAVSKIHFFVYYGYWCSGVCFLTFAIRLTNKEKNRVQMGAALGFLALMGAYVFGLLVYPIVSSSFGGGAVWLATVRMKTESPDNIQLGELLKADVPLLRYGPETVTVLSCSGSLQDWSCKAVLIPRDQVSYLVVHKEIAMDVYLAMVLRKTPQGPSVKRPS
jgi:hypothetical protein